MNLKLSYFLIPVLFFVLPIQAQVAIEELNIEQYYDFWIGDWNATWQEQDGTTGRGTNKIYKVLDDKVLYENFEILEGQNKGFKGKSMSVYQFRKRTWKQAWTDNDGGYYDFTGEIDGDKRIFKTAVKVFPDGRKYVQRMVFYNISENAFTWDWEASNDGGESWKLNWRINYTRVNK